MIGTDVGRYSTIVEREINGLLDLFKRCPYYFRVEQDIHCYLYSKLIQYTEFNAPYSGSNSISTKLLHKELPSINRGGDDGSGTKYRFDLAILDSNSLNSISDWDIFADSTGRTIPPLIAIELSLNYGNEHLEDDFNKIQNPINRVKKGYIIHLMRDDTFMAEDRVGMKRMIEVSDQSEMIDVYSIITYTPYQGRNIQAITRSSSSSIDWIEYFPKRGWESSPPELMDRIVIQTRFNED